LCNTIELFLYVYCFFFFFSSRRRHTRFSRDWSSDVCSSDLLYEHIASLNTLLNLYLPPSQEAEHRFAMGALPDEIMEICQRLAKLTEQLRGLAELFLNDLSEKTA